MTLSGFRAGIKPPQSGYAIKPAKSLSGSSRASSLSVENITYTDCGSMVLAATLVALRRKKRFSISFPYASTNLITPGSIIFCVTVISWESLAVFSRTVPVRVSPIPNALSKYPILSLNCVSLFDAPDIVALPPEVPSLILSQLSPFVTVAVQPPGTSVNTSTAYSLI